MIKTRQELPLYQDAVQAGFPSPASDFIEDTLDLNVLLVKHPAATFLVKVEGDSMINAGIRSGDILIVDRSVQPGDGKIVIAVVDGEMTVKRLRRSTEGVYLAAENPRYPAIHINPEQTLHIWGVVTSVVHGV